MVFAWSCLGRSSSLASTNFDNVRSLWVKRRDPIETVASQIHEPATVIQVTLQRLQHRLRPVLRVRAGQHHFVGCQEVLTFKMEVFIGYDVEGMGLSLQPFH